MFEILRVFLAFLFKAVDLYCRVQKACSAHAVSLVSHLIGKKHFKIFLQLEKVEMFYIKFWDRLTAKMWLHNFLRLQQLAKASQNGVAPFS